MNKTILSLLFLSAFLFLRVANVHAFSHFSDEGEIHCELCEFITTSQDTTPFSHHTSVETEDNSTPIEVKNLTLDYDVPLYCIVSPTFVYNKPPPSL